MSEKFNPHDSEEERKRKANDLLLRHMRETMEALGPDVVGKIFPHKEESKTKDNKLRGEGFTVMPSSNNTESGKHPVEFRQGASNVDAIENDSIIKGDGFTVKPSKGTTEAPKHPVEFRSGASNINEIEEDQKLK